MKPSHNRTYILNETFINRVQTTLMYYFSKPTCKNVRKRINIEVGTGIYCWHSLQNISYFIETQIKWALCSSICQYH